MIAPANKGTKADFSTVPVLPSLLSSQLKSAAEIWPLISRSSTPSDRWLGNFYHQHRKRFGSHDRRFISETIYSAFRHKAFLEAWTREWELENPDSFVLLAAAAEGLVTGEEFKVTGVNLKIPPGAYEHLKKHTLPAAGAGLSPEEKMALEFSFPLWLVKVWFERLGEKECRALLSSFQQRPPLAVRANTLKMPREKLIASFQSTGWKVFPATRASSGIIFEERVNVFDSPAFREGFFEVQDEGSQLVCEKINPLPGETVWDVCAGGGGKTLSLAALMNGKGRVIATDIRAKKLEELKKRARRAGATNIFAADLNRLGDLKEMRQKVDKIVVDAPCSGTGTLRRNPDAKWKLDPLQFARFHEDQVSILEKALPYLKPGGRIYYITCSIESAENEEVFEEMLQKHPSLTRLSLSESKDGFFRLFPHRDGTDGFFLAGAENKG